MSFFNAGITIPFNGLRFHSNNNNVSLRPPSDLSSSYTLTLPSTDGLAGYYLVTDGSGNLSWSGGLDADVYSNVVLRSLEGDITFATEIGSANVSVDESNTIVFRVGTTDVATVDLTSLDIGVATQSSSTSTGALTTSGGVGVAKNVYVGGDLVVEGDTKADSITIDDQLTFSNVSGDLVIKNNNEDKDILFTANTGVTSINLIRLDASAETIEYNGTLVYGVDVFNDSVGAATNLWNGSNISSTKQIVLNTGSSTSNFSCSAGIAGQHMHIMFTSNASGAEANIDFGEDSLYSGDGPKRYLLFTETGQSSSLIYLTYSTDTSLNGWRVINAGAQVI